MPNIEMKNNVALLGGSFDPVHIGHIELLHNAYSLVGFSGIVLIPAYISNFKQDSSPASFFDRVNMLRLAIEDYRELYPDDGLEITISLYEGEMRGVSYTSDTIRHLFSSYEENGKVNFIIGDDILPDLYKWHDFGYIKEHVRFYCFSREGKNGDYGAEVHLVHSPITVASSTLIKRGDRNMLTRRVKGYIDEHSLY